MKYQYCSLLLGASLWCSCIMIQRAEAAVSVGFFRTVLEPHGEWIDVGDYGPCWHPTNARGDWRPYTQGRWVYTDDGWCWDSDEPYGWVVYHYGRWVDLQDTGWCWVPDTEWAPAWVSFRHSDDYIGWAPLPPEARFRSGVSISFGGWVDSYFDIGPRYYSFVPIRRFGEPRVFDVILRRDESANIFARTVNITNIRMRENRVFVGGPEYDRLIERTGVRIPRLQLEREMNFADNVKAGSLRSRIESNRFIVPAPEVRGDARQIATNIGRRVDKPQINRGWRDVPNSRASEIRRKAEQDARPPQEVTRDLLPVRGREPGEESRSAAERKSETQGRGRAQGERQETGSEKSTRAKDASERGSQQDAERRRSQEQMPSAERSERGRSQPERQSSERNWQQSQQNRSERNEAGSGRSQSQRQPAGASKEQSQRRDVPRPTREVSGERNRTHSESKPKQQSRGKEASQ